MRILVFRGGALGDFIITLPALRALRTLDARTHVELVGNRRAGELGLIDGCVQAVHDQHEARWARLFDDAPLPSPLADWLAAFDVIVNYWPDPEGILARHFAAWGDRHVTGSASGTQRPAARRLLAPLRTLEAREPDDLAPVIRFPREIIASSTERTGGLDNLVAIHPGSGSRSKNWPLARWHVVARALNRPLLWITGEAEADCPAPDELAAVVAARWPLPILGAALARCGCYLGHDTGISHLAAAAGARGVLLFGPTDPAVWAPPTPRMRILRGDGGSIDAISVEAVVGALPR